MLRKPSCGLVPLHTGGIKHSFERGVGLAGWSNLSRSFTRLR